VRTVAVLSLKGGVGKTTVVLGLASSAMRRGARTLVVDLDPQCNATVTLGLDREERPSAYDTLCGEVSVAEAARPTRFDNLWVVPANRDLAGAAVELPGLERSEYRLRDGLGPVRERFAATFLDCPPSLGPITVNALAAADRVIVPVQAEYLALEGLVQFLDTLQTVRRQLNPSLVLTGIAITMADDRTRLSQDVEHELKDHFTDLVLETVIPRSVRLAEAPSFGMPVIAHAPSSRGSVAYRALAKEVLARD